MKRKDGTVRTDACAVKLNSSPEKVCDGDCDALAKIWETLSKKYPGAKLPSGIMMRGSKLVSIIEPPRMVYKSGRKTISTPIYFPYCSACGGRCV